MLIRTVAGLGWESRRAHFPPLLPPFSRFLLPLLIHGWKLLRELWVAGLHEGRRAPAPSAPPWIRLWLRIAGNNSVAGVILIGKTSTISF